MFQMKLKGNNLLTAPPGTEFMSSPIRIEYYGVTVWVYILKIFIFRIFGVLKRYLPHLYSLLSANYRPFAYSFCLSLAIHW